MKKQSRQSAVLIVVSFGVFLLIDGAMHLMDVPIDSIKYAVAQCLGSLTVGAMLFTGVLEIN